MERIVGDKKAQQITLSTLIMIVLGVVVLALLIYGFNVGWGNIFDNVNQYTGSSNVDTVRSACALACSQGETGGQSAYCTEERKVKFGTELELGKDKKKESGVTTNCKDLAINSDYDSLNIADCSAITCPTAPEKPSEE